MSTVKTNNLQIGQSVTATNNATWYQPSTPDGTVRLGVGNAGATSSDILIANSSGNLGLGVTPSAWNSVYRSLQIGSASSISGRTNSNLLELGSNSYRNSGGGWTYITTDTASRYDLADGTHRWYTAPSGTAGNAISFTQAMTLDASGNLLVGTTTAPSSGKMNIVNGFQMTGASTGTAISSNNGSAEVAYLTLGASYNVAGSYDVALGITNIATTAGKRIIIQNRTAGVYVADGGTSWTSNSDERLKTDLKPIENAAQKVSTLRAVTGRYIVDEEGVSRSFLIAQDVQAVLPEAVDASDPDKLGVAYTDTIPLLVAAIKELSAELNELKQKVNA